MARVLIPLLLVGLVLPSLLVGCSGTGNTETECDVTTKAEIPPIDAYTPPAMETATFALG
jgi:hypothetical protein